MTYIDAIWLFEYANARRRSPRWVLAYIESAWQVRYWQHRTSVKPWSWPRPKYLMTGEETIRAFEAWRR